MEGEIGLCVWFGHQVCIGCHVLIWLGIGTVVGGMYILRSHYGIVGSGLFELPAFIKV